ncbi:MAG: LD-carboxypeptidase [Ignavibacteriales bacterium]|nr:LD-carboxypeptidase [Ignavibacteriales bacterium]
MTIIKPSALKKGDLIGIIAPASPPSVSEKITKGAEYLERLGYRVKLGKNVHNVYGYLAGTDQERADDIHEMFADRNVKAIVAVRGGYGTPRLLPLLNYSLIKKNPKILVGYSDLTGLQLALFKKTGLVTFSGPMAGVEMWKEIDPFTEEHFWRMITSKKKFGAVHNPDGREFKALNSGTASGRLLGGNLSLITAIAGSPYIPSFKGSLLFLEEIEEECYRFDRMMNHLRIANILTDTKGVIIGELTDVKASDTTKPFLTVDQILNAYLKPLKKPVVNGLVYGHIPKKLTMPVGIKATVNANSGTLSFDEAAVV